MGWIVGPRCRRCGGTLYRTHYKGGRKDTNCFNCGRPWKDSDKSVSRRYKITRGGHAYLGRPGDDMTKVYLRAFGRGLPIPEAHLTYLCDRGFLVLS